MKRAIILGCSAAAILAVAYLWPTFGASSMESGSARWRDVHRGSLLLRAIGEGRHGRAQLAHERVTLDPDQFVGPAKQAYQVAEKSPALLAQLHCYCGCDRSVRPSESTRLLSTATTARSAKSASERR